MGPQISSCLGLQYGCAGHGHQPGRHNLPGSCRQSGEDGLARTGTSARKSWETSEPHSPPSPVSCRCSSWAGHNCMLVDKGVHWCRPCWLLWVSPVAQSREGRAEKRFGGVHGKSTGQSLSLSAFDLKCKVFILEKKSNVYKLPKFWQPPT